MRKTIKEIKDLLIKIHGDTVSIKEETYQGTKNKAIFTDKEYGDWEAIPHSVIRGSRHPQRALDFRKNNVSVFEFQNRLDKKFSGIILVDSASWINTHTQCWFSDIEYGRWFAYPRNVLVGAGHPQRAAIAKANNTKYSQLEFENLLNKVHNGKVKLIGEYKGMLLHHTFLNEEYGEFVALPANVIHKETNHIRDAVNRRVATSIEKYGVRHPMQDVVIANKCAKANVRSEIILHWKTKEELVCVASYEQKTVHWLNDNQIEFEWQNKTFTMPNGRTYRPDLFLVDKNVWVEIKGVFKRKSKEKWDWFHTQYPNSELWDKLKLQDLGIL